MRQEEEVAQFMLVSRKLDCFVLAPGGDGETNEFCQVRPPSWEICASLPSITMHSDPVHLTAGPPELGSVGGRNPIRVHVDPPSLVRQTKGWLVRGLARPATRHTLADTHDIEVGPKGSEYSTRPLFRQVALLNTAVDQLDVDEPLKVGCAPAKPLAAARQLSSTHDTPTAPE